MCEHELQTAVKYTHMLVRAHRLKAAVEAGTECVQPLVVMFVKHVMRYEVPMHRILKVQRDYEQRIVSTEGILELRYQPCRREYRSLVAPALECRQENPHVPESGERRQRVVLTVEVTVQFLCKANHRITRAVFFQHIVNVPRSRICGDLVFHVVHVLLVVESVPVVLHDIRDHAVRIRALPCSAAAALAEYRIVFQLYLIRLQTRLRAYSGNYAEHRVRDLGMIPGSCSQPRFVVPLQIYPVKAGHYHVLGHGISVLRKFQADRHSHCVVAADERFRQRFAGFKEPVHCFVCRILPEFAAYYVAVIQSQTVQPHYLPAALDTLLRKRIVRRT